MEFLATDPLSSADLDRSRRSLGERVLACSSYSNNFTRRTEVLAKIKDAIQNNHCATGAKQQQRFVITGMEGQGKNEVCLKIADMVRH